MRTVNEAKVWGKEHHDECVRSYAECKEIPDFLRGPHLELVWITGCWLRDAMLDAGATNEQVEEVGFCHGQRCLYQDPWKTAVAYANEFEANKAVKDKPGFKLANSLNEEHMGVVKA